MSLKVLGVVVILAVGEGLCFQVAIPSRNLASSASERSASGRYFNQNMYSKDDSKVRHMTTTLLDNENSNIEKANAQSEPFYGYPVGLLEPVAFFEATNPASDFLVEPLSVNGQPGVLIEPVTPCSKSEGNQLTNVIPPLAIPGLSAFESVNMYPQLPFPYYLPIPQPSLPAQILEVIPKEPVQVLEEVQISSPDSDTKESMIVVETPPELPAFPFFPPFYPAPLFYPSTFYPPNMYPFSPPQFPQQDTNCS